MPRPSCSLPGYTMPRDEPVHTKLQSTLLPPYTGFGALRVATYNIHKGVRGVGPRKRLEIHNLGLAVEALDADLVFLQEVRLFHTRDARHFDRTSFGWPDQGQADYLAPTGLRGGLPQQCRHAPRRAWQRAAVALAARRHRPPRRQRPPLRAARPAARAGGLERQ
jgi:endonuclease/exonuclease/phosphatase family metal-dependent hydrolase